MKIVFHETGNGLALIHHSLYSVVQVYNVTYDIQDIQANSFSKYS